MSFFDTLRSSALSSAKTTVNVSTCSFCSMTKTELGVCDTCLNAIESVGHFCSRCASTLETKEAQDLHRECGQCINKPPVYDTVITATRYKYPVDKALSELKFNKQLHYARSLSHVLERKVRQRYIESPLPQALVPIPLHPKRLKERGFNQSQLITQQLASSLNIPQASALARVKDTPHQVGLSEKQRRKNLNNAFHLNSPLPQHIALVDDVVTTGSTVTEATKLCRKQGVKRVDIWCLAKT